jgi:hypothetical protein
MTYRMPSAFLLIALFSYSALAEGQSVGSDQIHQAHHSDASALMPPSRASWESWLGHGAHNSTTTSPLSAPASSQNVDLAASNASRVPSVRPGPGFIGPEPADGLSRFKFNMEMERSDGGSGRR